MQVQTKALPEPSLLHKTPGVNVYATACLRLGEAMFTQVYEPFLPGQGKLSIGHGTLS